MGFLAAVPQLVTGGKNCITTILSVQYPVIIIHPWYGWIIITEWITTVIKFISIIMCSKARRISPPPPDFAGPCPVSSMEAMLDCELNSVTVSWHPSVGALSYVAEMTAASGHSARCAANQTNCMVSSLHCGEDYNVTVTAVGESCNSSTQMLRDVSTGTYVTLRGVQVEIMTVAEADTWNV